MKYEQTGKDCVYAEDRSEEIQVWNPKTETWETNKNGVAYKRFRYGNTSCEKVIDYELRNQINKSAITNYFHQ